MVSEESRVLLFQINCKPIVIVLTVKFFYNKILTLNDGLLQVIPS